MRFFLLFVISFSLFGFTPVEIKKSTDITDTVLFERYGYHVVMGEDFSLEAAKNLYVVQLPMFLDIEDEVAEFGEIIKVVPNNFLVINVPRKNVEKLSAFMHTKGGMCGALRKLRTRPLVKRTIAVTPRIPLDRTHEDLIHWNGQVKANNIKNEIIELAKLNTRFHRNEQGKFAANFVRQVYMKYVGDRTDVSLETFDHGSATPQKSFVARITGQKYPNEIIVLGSHIDSINARSSMNGRSPGVDDNASGTATNMEIFRVLMEQNIKLERTLEIHGYAAEEIGLVGSEDMARKYSDAKKKVLSMLQFDMNLYKAAGTEDKIWFISNGTDKAFNKQLQLLVEKYVKIPWGEKPLYAGTSDHASWMDYGFPASFPTENPSAFNNNIHTPYDDLERANAFSQAASFAKLGLAYVTHFAGIAK